MSISIKIRLKKLKMEGGRAEGIKLIRNYLKSHKPTDEISLELAFFLYHEALIHIENKKSSIKQRKEAESMFNEAIKICINLIKKDKKIVKNTTINARIFLAQILAIMGEEEEAIRIAKENFKLNKNSIMANRLADVYNRSNLKKEALYWYKKSEKLSKRKDDLAFSKLSLACFYLSLKNNNLVLRYKKDILKLLPSIKDSLTQKIIEKQLSDI